MLLISSILTPILEPVQTFLTPKKHFKLQALFFSIYPLFFIFHKSYGEGLQYFEFIFVVVPVRSDVKIFSFDFGQDNPINFLLMKFYLLFRVNFLYSKVVFNLIRVNWNRVYFQYLNFMER